MQKPTSDFWATLAGIRWCPVLTQPPEKCLPWPPAPSQLAAPRDVRLAKDVWLASSCMAILDGECRYTGLQFLPLPSVQRGIGHFRSRTFACFCALTAQLRPYLDMRIKARGGSDLCG